MSILSDILGVANPLVHSFTDGTSVTLFSSEGAIFDPEDLDASPGAGTSVSVPCSSPWPYRIQGLGVETGMFKVSLDGSLPALTITPKVGLLAEIDGRRYTIVEAHHDLDSNDWILLLEGAG